MLVLMYGVLMVNICRHSQNMRHLLDDNSKFINIQIDNDIWLAGCLIAYFMKLLYM
jgi:uncharacterized protein YdeI (BOF family)